MVAQAPHNSDWQAASIAYLVGDQPPLGRLAVVGGRVLIAAALPLFGSYRLGSQNWRETGTRKRRSGDPESASWHTRRTGQK